MLKIRHYLQITLVFCVLSMIQMSAHAQSKNQAIKLMDVWLEAQRDYNQWPSLSVAFVHGQETVFAKSYGYANPKENRKATPDTLYSICSISKLFTATGIMQLRDAGKVNIDIPIETYLDWYKIKSIDPDGGPVTLANILSHSSGLMREVDKPYWSGPDFIFPSREEVKIITATQKTLYRPYEHYQYSNLGLSLAGEVITSVSGMTFNNYINDNILIPLKMTDTYTSIPEKLHGKNFAVGYSALNRSGKRDEVRLFDAKGINPAAGFASSVNDLAIFAKWQLRILAENKTEVLNHNTLREMQRPHWLMDGWKHARGLGFGIYPKNDTIFVGHGGSCPGYRSQIVVDNNSQTGMISMVNSSGVDIANINTVMHEILADSLENDEIESDDSFTATDYEGIYGNQPWNGESAIIAWGKGLVAVGLNDSDPMATLTRLKHVKGDTFVRLRKDKSRAEPVIFHRNAKGRITHVQWHSWLSPKLNNLK